MTLAFDRKAREQLRTQQTLFENPQADKDTEVNTMIVKTVPTSFVRGYVAEFHYSHVMPDNAFECFAGFYDDKLAGVVVYGNGANNEAFRAIIPEIEIKNCRELMRLWSPDGMPKNTESKLISETIKMLPNEVYLVISFADPSHNHLGKIYQATNFFYCGKSNPAKMLINDKNERFHVRTIGSYKRRHPELRALTNLQVMERYNWKYVNSVGKHRYVYLRGEDWIKNLMLEKIKDRILPYPKEIGI